MEWFYDVLRFCNYVYTLDEIGSGDGDYKMLKGHCEDIIEGEDKYSSNEIANAYILKKCRTILDMIEGGDRETDISIYISILRKEGGDIVLYYNEKRDNNEENNE